MARGQTTEEFRDQFIAENPNRAAMWVYFGGDPESPGWVSDEAREIGDRCGLDAEALDNAATDDGWEFHDHGYREKIEECARNAKERGIPKAS